MMQETNQNHHVHIFHSFFEHNESPLLSHYAFMINIINLSNVNFTPNSHLYIFS